jgi:hypothetical protein
MDRIPSWSIRLPAGVMTLVARRAQLLAHWERSHAEAEHLSLRRVFGSTPASDEDLLSEEVMDRTSANLEREIRGIAERVQWMMMANGGLGGGLLKQERIPASRIFRARFGVGMEDNSLFDLVDRHGHSLDYLCPPMPGRVPPVGGGKPQGLEAEWDDALLAALLAPALGISDPRLAFLQRPNGEVRSALVARIASRAPEWMLRTLREVGAARQLVRPADLHGIFEAGEVVTGTRCLGVLGR